MNFATLQGLIIPDGAVTQIADASGRVLWSASKPVVLNVAKQTLTTYAGETSYADEQFVLLNIYPKTNGTVKVTYGGLTKTITDTSGVSEPNAQKVFFGTFNGVSDSVVTPASGALTIEGAYANFAVGSYQSGSKTTNTGYCDCITDVVDWGSITSLAFGAFRGCTSLALISLPSGITSIGNQAFYGCSNLALISLPSGLTNIGASVFYGCTGLTSISIPASVTSIDTTGILGTFQNCNNLKIEVDSGNEYYSAENGVLFNKNKTNLLAAPSIKGNYTIPNGVATIGECAFYERKAHTTIEVPASVTAIEDNAFYMSTSNDVMTVKMLSASPPTLGANVFNPSEWSGGAYGYHTEIIVPAGCAAVYKVAEGWSEYADRIVEAS